MPSLLHYPCINVCVCVLQVRGSECCTLSVAYLSPLVLRKELETMLGQEGDHALIAPTCPEKHPVLYWNMVRELTRSRGKGLWLGVRVEELELNYVVLYWILCRFRLILRIIIIILSSLSFLARCLHSMPSGPGFPHLTMYNFN